MRKNIQWKKNSVSTSSVTGLLQLFVPKKMMFCIGFFFVLFFDRSSDNCDYFILPHPLSLPLSLSQIMNEKEIIMCIYFLRSVYYIQVFFTYYILIINVLLFICKIFFLNKRPILHQNFRQEFYSGHRFLLRIVV